MARSENDIRRENAILHFGKGRRICTQRWSEEWGDQIRRPPPFRLSKNPGQSRKATVAFVGPRHEGGSPHNVIEVIAASREDGLLHAFHAMPITDRWMHLMHCK